MAKVEFKFYSNTDKDSNYYRAKELGLSEEAERTFAYCGYEIEFDAVVDTDTGEVFAHAMNGIPTTAPVRLT
jgi:hypothetical protein